MSDPADPVQPAPAGGRHDGRARRTIALGVLADVVCILVFATAGRDAHDEGSSALIVLRIAWPYLVGLAVAWLVVTGKRMRPVQLWPSGVFVWATTYLVGMALRGLSGDGLAPAFLIVALCFLALTMLGWRFVVIGKRKYRR